MARFIATVFIAGCGLGFAASSVTSTVSFSESRAEAAALAKMQQRHPAESYLVTRAQLQLESSEVSDSAGQSYGSPWTACFPAARGGPLGLLPCPPPAIWAIELATPSKQRSALVVVDAQNGAVMAVLIHLTESS